MHDGPAVLTPHRRSSRMSRKIHLPIRKAWSLLSIVTTEKRSQSSDPTYADARLAEVRRAKVLVHTRYPEPGRLYPASLSALVGIWIASFAAPSGFGLPIRLTVFVTFLVGAFRYNRRRGTQPTLRSAPRPIRNALFLYVAYVVVMVAALGLLWRVAPWWVVSGAGALAAAMGTRWYMRYFAVAARRAEVDSGIVGSASTT